MAEQKITFAEYAMRSRRRPEFIQAFMVKFKIGPDFESTYTKFDAAMEKWLNTPVKVDQPKVIKENDGRRRESVVKVDHLL